MLRFSEAEVLIQFADRCCEFISRSSSVARRLILWSIAKIATGKSGISLRDETKFVQVLGALRLC